MQAYIEYIGIQNTLKKKKTSYKFIKEKQNTL